MDSEPTRQRHAPQPQLGNYANAQVGNYVNANPTNELNLANCLQARQT